MAHSDTFEKEKEIRRCLFEIATFDSVDFKTLSSERLQRFLLLSKQYSAYSQDPAYQESFFKLVAVYDISPNLSERIERAAMLDFVSDEQGDEAYFGMLKEEEFNAMMQMRYEMYLKTLNGFKESYIKLFDTAKTYTNDVHQLTNRIFMNGATEKERQEALRQVYMRDPVLAWSIVKDKYGDNVPKVFLPFMPPQKVALLVQEGKLKKEGLSTIYATNPQAVVQALEALYTQKGLPIPPQFLPFSKLPAGYESVAGNIFVGPIQIDGAMIERAMDSKTQLEAQARKTAEDAKNLDAQANNAKIPPEKYQEQVLDGTPTGQISDGASVVVEGVLDEDDISQMLEFASQTVVKVGGIAEAKKVNPDALQALNKGSGTQDEKTQTRQKGEAEKTQTPQTQTGQVELEQTGQVALEQVALEQVTSAETNFHDPAFVYVPETTEKGEPVSAKDIADMDISLMGDGVNIFVQNQEGDILPLDMNLNEMPAPLEQIAVDVDLNKMADPALAVNNVDVTSHLKNAQLVKEESIDMQVFVKHERL